MTKTEIKFYNPYKKKNEFLRDLKKSFDTATEVWIATAFFDKSGYELLKDGIRALLKKRGKVLFLVDKGGCKSMALRRLYNLKNKFENKNNSPLELKYYNRKYPLHSKFYFFDSKSPVLFMGSSNLTGSGFEGNIETNVSIKGDLADFKEFYTKLWGTCRDLKAGDVDEIENYAKEKGKFDKRGSGITLDLPLSGEPRSTPREPETIKRKFKRKTSSPKIFIDTLYHQLPSNYQKKFKCTREVDGWGYLSEVKKCDVLNYSFHFDDNKQYVKVVLWLGSKNEGSKKFVEYLKKIENKQEFASLLKKLKHNYEVEVWERYARIKPFDGPNDYCGDASRVKVKTISNKMKNGNKSKNHTAVLWIRTKKRISVTNFVKIKGHIEELMSLYNFIKKGIKLRG